MLRCCDDKVAQGVRGKKKGDIEKVEEHRRQRNQRKTVKLRVPGDIEIMKAEH